MKLYLEDENGNRTQIKQVEDVGVGDLVIKVTTCMRQQDKEKLEDDLSKRFGRKVIVLDASVDKILTVPPFEKV